MNYFPQEILIEILKHVDRNKKQLSLVSKSFYNAFKFLNEDVWLVINSNILDDKNIYNSILETTRRIRNIEMQLKLDQYSEYKDNQVLRIIEKQSKNIKELVIKGSYSQQFLEEVFKLIPKLDLLDLQRTHVTRFEFTYSPRQNKKLKMSEPEEFNLRQVKKLILPNITSDMSKYVLDLMYNLDHGSLNELEVVMRSHDYTRIHELIDKQPNLKVLKLIQDFSFRENMNTILPPTFLSNCDLKHLEWKISSGIIYDEAQRKIVNSILERMKNLRVMKLYHANYPLEYSPIQRFNIITANLKKLETLEIYDIDIDYTSIANLNDLIKLRNFTLDFSHSSQHSETILRFYHLTLPQLESFAAINIEYSNTNNINIVERLSTTSMQNVKKLNLDIPQDKKSFRSILQYFPQVESFTIHRRDCSSKLTVTFSPELENLNLKELNMTFNLDMKTIGGLIECFPNIEKLSMNCVGLGEIQFLALLENLRFLKYLKITVPHSKSWSKPSFDKRMIAVFEHGHSLEVFIYRTLIGDTDILKMFENKFEYINIKRSYRSELTMATNRKILNSYPTEEFYY